MYGPPRGRAPPYEPGATQGLLLLKEFFLATVALGYVKYLETNFTGVDAK